MATPDLYLVDAAFLARRTIRSLPEFHGARWSAWLRHACRQCGLALDDMLMGILPLRSGQTPIRAGEVILLRMVVGEPGRLGALGAAMANTACRGEFSPQAFELCFWRETLSGRRHPPDVAPCGLAPLTLEQVRAQAERLASLNSFTLDLHTPLRLKLPQGLRQRGPEVESYCQQDFFSSGRALEYLAAKVRFWEFAEAASLLEDACLTCAASNLAWCDLRYNQERRVALGGLTGRLACAGRIGLPVAERLALGQYLGAGKNPLFGLGYWNIPELAGC